jgi:hypothetical protein
LAFYCQVVPLPSDGTDKKQIHVNHADWNCYRFLEGDIRQNMRRTGIILIYFYMKRKIFANQNLPDLIPA